MFEPHAVLLNINMFQHTLSKYENDEGSSFCLLLLRILCCGIYLLHALADSNIFDLQEDKFAANLASFRV